MESYQFHIYSGDIYIMLLDERILIGDSLTANKTMRPLAYSVLADRDLSYPSRSPARETSGTRLFSQHLADSYPRSTNFLREDIANSVIRPSIYKQFSLGIAQDLPRSLQEARDKMQARKKEAVINIPSP